MVQLRNRTVVATQAANNRARAAADAKAARRAAAGTRPARSIPRPRRKTRKQIAREAAAAERTRRAALQTLLNEPTSPLSSMASTRMIRQSARPFRYRRIRYVSGYREYPYRDYLDRPPLDYSTPAKGGNGNLTIAARTRNERLDAALMNYNNELWRYEVGDWVRREEQVIEEDLLAKWMEENNIEADDYREIDKQKGRLMKSVYDRKERNWATVKEWEKRREHTRLRILRKLHINTDRWLMVPPEDENDDESDESEQPDVEPTHGCEIASGGQGRVYRLMVSVPLSRNVSSAMTRAPTKKLVAVKLSFSVKTQREQWWLRFLKPFQHPNLAKILDLPKITAAEHGVWNLIDLELANCGDLYNFMHERQKYRPGTRYEKGGPEYQLSYENRDEATFQLETPPEDLAWLLLQQLLSAVSFLHTGIKPDGSGAAHNWVPIW
jgi:hypothetical protein